MTNDANKNCSDETRYTNSETHDFIVVDWAYTGGAPNVHPHSKVARRLLCQKCFVEYDLAMIARARTHLLSNGGV